MSGRRLPLSGSASAEGPSAGGAADTASNSSTIDDRLLAGAAPRRHIYAALKRALDLFVAVTLLVVLFPVLLAVILLVKMSSRGPAIFSQIRVGKHGRTFSCYKFRTMRDGAEALLASDSRLSEEFKESWKIRDDPRVTGVGQFLRRTSIDELPQLVNVVSGHMSLVGPRPILPEQLPMFGDSATALLSVNPGMTGLWQISGRSMLPYEERVRLDLQYVSRSGFWYDVVIMLKTIPVVLTRKGAL